MKRYQDWQDYGTQEAPVVTLAEKLTSAALMRVRSGGKPSSALALSKQFRQRLTAADYDFYLAAIAEISEHENQPNKNHAY